MSTSSSRRPSPAAIRRALDECLTLPDIDAAQGWSAGTAAKYRQRPAPVGLPEPDATVGRTPVWFRATIERWQAERPGRGAGGAAGPRCGRWPASRVLAAAWIAAGRRGRGALLGLRGVRGVRRAGLADRAAARARLRRGGGAGTRRGA